MSGLKVYHKIESLSFDSSCEESKCHVKHLLPAEQELPNKIWHIAFVHDLFSYGDQYEDLFNKLRDFFKEKLLISSFDLVGHGLSTGSRAYVDQFSSFSKDYLRFLRTSLDYYHGREVTTILIGAGLGGTICLDSISHYRSQLPYAIDSAIVLNPVIKLKMRLSDLALKLTRGLKKYVGKVHVDSIYPIEELSSISEKKLQYKNDPLISKVISINLLVELINSQKQFLDGAYYINHPIKFLLSRSSEITDIKYVESFMRAMPKELAHARYFNEAKHDLLNDMCANEIIEEIIDYISHSSWETRCIE